jgi:HSP20 family protein
MLIRRVWPSRPTFESPFADFEQLRRQVLRAFDAMGSDTFGDMGATVFPPVNVSQDSENYYVRAEVPGIEPKQLDISALGRRLTLSGKREIAQEDSNASYHRKERAAGSFNRTITLPAEFVAAKVDAQYRDGILTITLPKAEAAKPRQIVVRS